MAKPGGSPENLIPNSKRTPEELKAITTAGGKRSGEVRREKKRIADIYASVLAKEYDVKDSDGKPIKVTGSDMIGTTIVSIINRGDGASVSMIKELREGIDGSKVKLTGGVDMTTYTPEEFQRKRDQFILQNAERIERLRKEAEERLMLEAPEEEEE
jgi:hypothetical protein